MKNIKKEAIKPIIKLFPLLSILILSSLYIYAVPSQPTIGYVSNSTSQSAGLGQASAGDKGGYITTITLNATQQNYAWKAYVGNVSGRMILENQQQFSIYEWDMGLSATGNVYIARNGTVDWNTLNCSNQTVIDDEDNLLNIPATNSKSINHTFNTVAHKAFLASGKNFANSTCPSIATYINDSAQTINETAKFQEVLLKDSASNLVYMTIMEDNQQGYDNSNFDFQAIVAEDETLVTPTTYYFYVELL